MNLWFTAHRENFISIEKSGHESLAEVWSLSVEKINVFDSYATRLYCGTKGKIQDIFHAKYPVFTNFIWNTMLNLMQLCTQQSFEIPTCSGWSGNTN